MIPERIDKYNWTYAAFLAAMVACKNEEFVKYVKENEEKEESEPFYFSIYENFCDRVYYIYRHEGKWKFWHYPKKESESFILERKHPVVFLT